MSPIRSLSPPSQSPSRRDIKFELGHHTLLTEANIAPLVMKDDPSLRSSNWRRKCRLTNKKVVYNEVIKLDV